MFSRHNAFHLDKLSSWSHLANAAKYEQGYSNFPPNPKEGLRICPLSKNRFPPILDKRLKIDLSPTSQGVMGSQTTFAHIFYSVGFCLFSFLNITQLDCKGNVFNVIPQVWTSFDVFSTYFLLEATILENIL